VLTELGFSESEVQSVLDHAEAVRQELMAAVLGES
jgi:hypothetical protein